MDKNEWRAFGKKQRKAMSEYERRFQSTLLARRIVADPRWERSKTVMLFLSFGSEWQTQELIESAWNSGKRVVMPVCLPDFIIQPSLYTSDTPLVETNLGLKEIEASTAIAVDPSEIDYCIIPGLLFDPYGTRLGYGAGFYDRFLQRLRPDCTQVATGFDCQFIGDRLPAEPTDFHIDEIILPSHTFYTLPLAAYQNK